MTDSDIFCLICGETISFQDKDVACVGRKGVETINSFSLKHNELDAENPIPIYDYNKNQKTYVHKSCRKKHTNARRYEQIKKRKY